MLFAAVVRVFLKFELFEQLIDKNGADRNAYFGWRYGHQCITRL